MLARVLDGIWTGIRTGGLGAAILIVLLGLILPGAVRALPQRLLKTGYLLAGPWWMCCVGSFCVGEERLQFALARKQQSSGTTEQRISRLRYEVLYAIRCQEREFVFVIPNIDAERVQGL